MSRRRHRRCHQPSYSQENFYCARYGPEGFRQKRLYRAEYDPGKGRVWRQEKKYCMSFGERFENDDR